MPFKNIIKTKRISPSSRKKIIYLIILPLITLCLVLLFLNNKLPIKLVNEASLTEELHVSLIGETVSPEEPFVNQLDESKLPEESYDGITDNWEGKATDWLSRIYDVNSFRNEIIGDSIEVISSTGWLASNDPYTITRGELKQVVMDEGHGWDSNSYRYPESKKTLEETDLSPSQRQYFYNHNYVPRAVEYFDVTGDGIKETIVTSLTLGCGRCVDFYMSIFIGDDVYNARASEGTIIRTENGNGFYLINSFPGLETNRINIKRYEWNSSSFVEITTKDVDFIRRKKITYDVKLKQLSTSSLI